MWACRTHPLKPHGGCLDFCPAVMQFQVHAIMQTQLTTLSQAGAWGDTKKGWWDMALLLIVPSLAVGCEWVFGLTAMWVHPCQAHLPTLGEVTQKLRLLTDISSNWLYAYVWMNDAMTHMPLSSEGHIGVTTDGIPSMNACGHLTNCRHRSYCNMGARWFALRG